MNEKKITISLPPTVQMILNRLATAGFEAFVVGGCVRDSLLGLHPQDWDVCTSAHPEEIQSVFEDFLTLTTGVKHGTIGVVTEKKVYEITTYRMDGLYSDKRRPDLVNYVSELKDDLNRRDFTINAMAYNETSGLIDYFGGQDDLKKKIIRCVGEPTMRFQEDALRILRALRFASVYSFAIESASRDALREHKNLLEEISAERIKEEWDKLLLGENAETILLDYADVISVFVPEIQKAVGYEQHNPYHVYDVWQHTVKAIGNAEKNITVRLALFLHDLEKPLCASEEQGYFYAHAACGAQSAQTILSRLRYDSKTIQTVTQLIFYHDTMLRPDKKLLKKWLNKIGAEELRMLLQVKRADASAQNPDFLSERLFKLNKIEETIQTILDDNECFSVKELAIDGRDLLNIGMQEGKRVGEALQLLLEKVIEEEIPNEKAALMEAAKKMIKN